MFIALEPMLLAPPPQADTAIVRAYCEMLAELSEFARKKTWFDIFVSDQTIGALVQSGLFPFGNQFGAVLQRAQLQDVYSSNDLKRLFNTVIEKSQREVDGVAIVLADGFVGPTVDDTEEPMRSAQEAFVALVAYWQVHCAQNVELVPYTRKKISALECKFVPAALGSAEGQLDSRLVEAHVSHRVSSVAVYDGESFADFLEPSRLWQAATTSAHLHLSITVATYQAARVSGNKKAWRTVAASFVIGTQFLSSLEENEGSGDSRFSGSVLHACQRIADGDRSEFS